MDGSTSVESRARHSALGVQRPVKHPPESSSGCPVDRFSPDDRLADLVEAIEARDGAKF